LALPASKPRQTRPQAQQQGTGEAGRLDTLRLTQRGGGAERLPTNDRQRPMHEFKSDPRQLALFELGPTSVPARESSPARRQARQAARLARARRRQFSPCPCGSGLGELEGSCASCFTLPREPWEPWPIDGAAYQRGKAEALRRFGACRCGSGLPALPDLAGCPGCYGRCGR